MEDVTASEVRELTSVHAYPVLQGSGRVIFRADLDAMYVVNFAARTINKLYLLLSRETFEQLEDIYGIARSIDYSQIVGPDKSFAVRCERLGRHSFTSIDVARVVGQAIIDSYIGIRGARPRVNLDQPDVEFSVFVRSNEFLMGINTTGKSLHKRWYRVYDHLAALKTTLAAAMLRLGEYRGQPLLDPLCGSATITIEAAHIARRYSTLLFRQEYSYRTLHYITPSWNVR